MNRVGHNRADALAVDAGLALAAGTARLSRRAADAVTALAGGTANAIAAGSGAGATHFLDRVAT